MRGRNGFYWTRLVLDAAKHGEWCGVRDLITFIGVDIRTELDFRDFGYVVGEALQEVVADLWGQRSVLERRRKLRQLIAPGLVGFVMMQALAHAAIARSAKPAVA